MSDHDFAITSENVPQENAVYSHIVTCLPAAICLVIVLRGAQISVEAWMGQTAVIFIEGSLGLFACFRVALRSVEVCLEGTSTAFIEASLKPFASF